MLGGARSYSELPGAALTEQLLVTSRYVTLRHASNNQISAAIDDSRTNKTPGPFSRPDYVIIANVKNIVLCEV